MSVISGTAYWASIQSPNTKFEPNWQIDVGNLDAANKDVGEFCSITKIAIKETEKLLKLRCHLDNDYKVGTTWAETH